MALAVARLTSALSSVSRKKPQLRSCGAAIRAGHHVFNESLGKACMFGFRSRNAEVKKAAPTDDELRAEISDIDAKLESQNAWLTPQFRTGLLAAREVLVNVLARRYAPWPGLFQRALAPPVPPRERGRQ